MRRALVLEDKSFRHPFRRKLATLPGWRAKPDVKPQRDPMSDRRFFFLSFVSGFIIFYGMIA